MKVKPMVKELNLASGTECYTYTIEVSTDKFVDMDCTTYQFLGIELLGTIEEIYNKQTKSKV